MQRFIKTNEFKGIILILSSSVAFCVMSALVKYASNIEPYKTTLFRFIIGLGILGTGALFGILVPVLSYIVGVILFHESFWIHSAIGSLIVITSYVAVLAGTNNKRKDNI